MYGNLVLLMQKNKITKSEIARTLNITRRTLLHRLENDQMLHRDIVIIRDTYFPDKTLDFIGEYKKI